MILRQFNSAGVEAFRQFLSGCRENPGLALPNELLEDAAFTVKIAPTIDVERQHFKNKGDAARYLSEILSPLDEQDLAKNAHLWSWLALFFFDEICPAKRGKRVVRNDYSYIFEPNNVRHFYRHLIFIAWRIVKVAPTHNRLFLSGSVASLDQVTTEVMKRLFLTRVPCIFEVLDRLYWDKERGRARSGIVTREKVKPGDLLHRFPLRIRQLEMTYDLQSLSADKLIDLLGEEFNHRSKPEPVVSR